MGNASVHLLTHAGTASPFSAFHGIASVSLHHIGIKLAVIMAAQACALNLVATQSHTVAAKTSKVSGRLQSTPLIQTLNSTCRG